MIHQMMLNHFRLSLQQQIEKKIPYGYSMTIQLLTSFTQKAVEVCCNAVIQISKRIITTISSKITSLDLSNNNLSKLSVVAVHITPDRKIFPGEASDLLCEV